MFEAIFDLSIKYKIPSLKVRYNRKIFCGLKKKRNELVNDWFNRVQDRINRCEFENISEVLLIDKFFCELNDDEIKPFLDTDTWSLNQLNEYFSSRNSKIIDIERTNTHMANGENNDQRPPSTSQTVKNEIVSTIGHSEFTSIPFLNISLLLNFHWVLAGQRMHPRRIKYWCK